MKKIYRSFLLLCCLSALTAGAQVNLSSGLVAYYPFNGNANDASGNNNHGTPSGSAALTTDQWGNANSAYTFNGTVSPGQITVLNSSSLQFTTGASFSFWAKLNSNVGTNGFGNIVAGGQHCFFAKEGDAGGGLFALTNLNSSTLNTQIGNVSNPTNVSNLNPYSVGQWVHYCFVIDATENRVYINGTLVQTATGAPNFTVMNGRNLYLARFGSGWYPMNGALDEFRVYNRVLNASEISALASVGAQASITVNSASPTTVCAGSAFSVSITASGIASGNTYTLEMSDASGSFAFPYTIGTLNSSAANATITGTVPAMLPSGTGYKVRVLSAIAPAVSPASSFSITVNGVMGDIPSAAGNFIYIGNVSGKEYFISAFSQVWTTARTTCQNNGGQLAIINDLATVNLLKNYAATGGSHIGMTDEVTEGTFLWVDGTPLTYTNWNSGEPNNSGNEDYGQMGQTGKWNDINNVYSNTFFYQLVPVRAATPVCEGSSLNLYAAPLPGATYSWSGPNGFTSTQQNPVISNVSSVNAGTYTVTFTKNGCSASATVVVDVNQSPDGNGESATLLPSLNSGMMLYYPMNGNANDLSGSNLNGTMLGGVAATSNRFGNATSALSFNGSNGYIDVPDGTYFNGTSFTINAWVKMNTYATWSRLIDFGNGAGNNNVLIGLTNGTSGRPASEIYNNTTSGGQITSPSTQLPIGSWAMVTWTWSGNTGTLFINGTQVTQGTQSAPANIVRTLNYIGRSNWAGDAYANASLDELRMYNRVLTPAEIRSLLLEQPDPLSVIASPAAICPNTATTIKIIGSQIGCTYQLQNAANSANIGTAQAGNGDTLSISTGNLAANISIQVVITGPGGCQKIAGPVSISLITPASSPTTTGATRCEPGTVTLSASGAPNGALYYWYTAPTGGTPVFIGPSYTLSVNSTTTFYVSIYASGCESNRTPVTATINYATGPAVDLYTNMIAWYKGQNNLADSSGRNNPLTAFSTVSYTNDRFSNPNSAVTATGGNFVSGGNPADFSSLNGPVTISMWVNENATNYNDFSPLVNKWAGDGIYMAILSNTSNGTNTVRWRVSINNYVDSWMNVPYNQWHHIVGVYDGSMLRVYQNGVLTAQGSAGNNFIPTLGVSLEIGRQSNGLGNLIYNGSWDDVRIYKRALNADEVMALFNNGSVAFSNSPLCEGQTLQLSSPVIPGATYAWSGPNSFSSTQAVPNAIANVTTAQAGQYSLIINNPNGCISSPQTNTVVVNTLPAAPQTINDTVCGSGNAVLTVSGGNSYAWYNTATGGSSIFSGSSYTINNLAATDTFYVAAINSSGCEGPRMPVIAVYNNPISTGLIASGSTVCSSSANATVTVSSSQNGVSYTAYYNSNPVSNTVTGNGNNITLTISTALLPTGTSTITIAASNAGCGSVSLADTATVNVHVPVQPVITSSGPTSFCTGGSVTLTASGSSPYLWSDGSTGSSITVNQPGSYTVNSSDAWGCSATSAAVTVNVYSIPNASITAGGPLSFCAGNSVTLTASAGSSYTWSDGSTSSSITVTQSGNYSVIVTNGGVCSDTSSVVAVVVNPLPNVSLALPVDTVCFAANPITLTGGSPAGGTYSGSGVTGNQFDPASAGLGDVQIFYSYTDVNGCSNTASYWVNVDLCLGIEAGAEAEMLTLIPNPTHDVAQLKWASGMQVSLIEIHDATGRLISKQVPSGNNCIIDTSHLPSGVYLVQVFGNTMHTLRLIRE